MWSFIPAISEYANVRRLAFPCSRNRAQDLKNVKQNGNEQRMYLQTGNMSLPSIRNGKTGAISVVFGGTTNT